ncbi:MAG: transposase family protein [Myxococcales bacterium]|nr:transposase family protein [Myxococcales bacterium]MBK7194491.1 transposase family protein [Myxococcales bacterium]
MRAIALRKILALRLLPKSDTDGVRAVFEDLFEEHGLPKVIQSDNGAPFAAGRSLAGLTQLSAWWVSLGIDVVRSRPGCPQDNGAHERMHADMSIDLQTRAAQTLRLQQRACDDWRVEFNHVRPHEALGMRVPADVYLRSSRRYRRGMLGLFPDGVDVIQLGANGKFWLDGRHHVFASTALRNAHIGLQRVEDELVHIWLHHMLIGYVRTNAALGRYVTVQPFEDPQWKQLAARRAERSATR